jgi:hypothetical protein
MIIVFYYAKVQTFMYNISSNSNEKYSIIKFKNLNRFMYHKILEEYKCKFNQYIFSQFFELKVAL